MRATAGARAGREVFRLAPPVVFWWIWVAFTAANVIDYAAQGLPSARFGAVVGAILLLVTGVVYTLALRPKVIADDAGLTVVNPYRTHRLPWPLITSVDTAEWVRVGYEPGRTLYCWALYVSAGARRKIARGAAQPRGTSRRLRSLLAQPAGTGPSSRLPEEARYLASLPAAKAIAVRLGTRAARERERADEGADSGNSGQQPPATASWSWLAIAAVVIPALVLLAVALA